VGVSAEHESYLESCAAYALGGLDEADRVRFEEHLSAGCAECEAALADYAAATVLLAASAPEAAPPPGLRARVIKAALAARPAATVERFPIPRTVEHPVLRRPSRWSWALAAAAVVLAVGAGVVWMTNADLRTEVARLGEELRVARERIATLELQSVEENRWARVLTSPNARVATLVPTPDAETTLKGRAIYDPSTRAAVVVLENVNIPSNRTYQLWAIRGGTPASLGLIRADKSGLAVMRVPDAGESTSLGAFAISLEPAGGSPNPAAPSGPVVMLGKLGG
jgi:anti-sigma-K factor RskA